MLDGEIVIAGPSGLDFDALSQRIHPAESRVELLARTTPASFVAFDLLALGDADLQAEPYADPPVDPGTGVAEGPAADPPHAGHHRARRGPGLVLAVRGRRPGRRGGQGRRSLPYQPDKRVMMKVKHERTADCVVGGLPVAQVR